MSDDVTGHYIMTHFWALAYFRYIVRKKYELWQVTNGLILFVITFFSVGEGFRFELIPHKILETLEE